MTENRKQPTEDEYSPEAMLNKLDRAIKDIWYKESIGGHVSYQDLHVYQSLRQSLVGSKLIRRDRMSNHVLSGVRRALVAGYSVYLMDQQQDMTIKRRIYDVYPDNRITIEDKDSTCTVPAADYFNDQWLLVLEHSVWYVTKGLHLPTPT